MGAALCGKFGKVFEPSNFSASKGLKKPDDSLYDVPLSLEAIELHNASQLQKLQAILA